MKRLKNIIALLSILIILGIPTITYSDEENLIEFEDYTRMDASEEVYELVDLGIVDAKGDLRPDDYMTRAEFVELFNKVFMLKSDGAKEQLYKDVPISHKSFDSINTIRSNGFKFDTNRDEFKPDSYITPSQAYELVIDGLGYGIKEGPYTHGSRENDYCMISYALNINSRGSDVYKEYANRRLIYTLLGKSLNVTFKNFGNGDYETLKDMHCNNKKIDYTKYDPEKVITFKSDIIENYIRETYKLSGDIKWKDVYDIKSIVIKDLSDGPIDNLSDLVWFNNLEELVLIWNIEFDGDFRYWKVYLPNLSHLKNLNRFEYVNENTSFELERFSGIKSLKVLDLPYSIVNGDLSVVSDMKDLRIIALSGDIIGKISDLAELKNLKVIYIPRYNNIVGDISLLANNLELQDVVFHANPGVYGDVKGFGSMKNLWRLNIICVTDSLYGDLESFKDLYNLKILCLNDIDIRGNLSSLKKISNIEILCLNNTKVEGNLDDLSLPNASLLEFANTKVYGNIERFASCEKLYHVDFSQCDMQGDLSKLKNNENLQYLDIDYSNIYGEITLSNGTTVIGTAVDVNVYKLAQEYNADYVIEFTDDGFEQVVRKKISKLYGKIMWKDIINIEELDLSDSNIISINDIIWFKNLRILSCNSNIYFIKSNLNVLKDLTKLEVIDLENSKIRGKISDLEKLTNLRELNLQNMKVGGDLSVIRSLSNIEKLNINNTDIECKFEMFKDLKNLKELSAFVQSNEDLAELSVLTNLEKLELLCNENEISGKLSELGNFKKLKSVILESNGISGDLSDVSQLKNIEIYQIVGNSITGDTSSFEKLKNLKNLLIASPNVKVNFDSLSKMSELEEIIIRTPKIEGELKALSNLKNLKLVYIKSNNINGLEDDLINVEHVTLEKY